MTALEALRQCRDALAKCAGYLDELPIWHNAGHPANLAHAAIAAAGAVLEQPEPRVTQEDWKALAEIARENWTSANAAAEMWANKAAELREEVDRLRAQPEQEPVTSQSLFERYGHPTVRDWDYWNRGYESGLEDAAPTVTLPPLRTLSDDDIARIAKETGMWPALSHDSERALSFVRAVLHAAGMEVKT